MYKIQVELNSINEEIEKQMSFIKAYAEAGKLSHVLTIASVLRKLRERKETLELCIKLINQ